MSLKVGGTLSNMKRSHFLMVDFFFFFTKNHFLFTFHFSVQEGISLCN